MNARSILTAVLLLAAAPALDAATLLTFQEVAPGSSSQPKAVRRMLLEGNRVRVETSGAGGSHVLIFQADTGTLWIIDQAKRSYTEVHRSVVPFNTENTEAADTEPSGTMTSPAGVSYKKVDSGFIVNSIRTDKYEGTKNGRKVEELYVADPKALGLDAAALKALHTMAEAFAQGTKDHIQMSLTAEVPGVAVRMIRFEGGKPAVQIDLNSVRQEDAPASAFEVPAGFTRAAQGLASAP